MSIPDKDTILDGFVNLVSLLLISKCVHSESNVDRSQASIRSNLQKISRDDQSLHFHLLIYNIKNISHSFLTKIFNPVIQIEDWHLLDQMVKESLNGLEWLWREREAHRRTKSDWATTDVVPKGREKTKASIGEEAIWIYR